MTQTVVRIRFINVGKEITIHSEDDIIREEVPFGEDYLHKMTKRTIIGAEDSQVEAVDMTILITVIILIIEAKDDRSNDDLGDPGDSNPGEEAIYLKQERATQNIDIYPNIDISVEFVATRVIMTINATHYNT